MTRHVSNLRGRSKTQHIRETERVIVHEKLRKL